MATFENIVPGRLWQVRDLLPQEQFDEIASTDWSSMRTHQSHGQESWPRQQVAWTDPVAQRYSRYINAGLPEINSALGTDFERSAGHFWIDLPGFRCDMHTDGHLSNAMQLYWIMPDHTYGTGFYRYNNTDSLVYQFASKPNTGYIMLNHANSDGSQPLQWHAMLNTVPVGTIRVSSYWYFE
jgi:hypothetical protein